MKYKIILFLIVMGFSLVHAFESPEYKIGMNIPSEGDIEVIIEPGIEISIINETNPNSNPGTSSGGGGGNSNSGGNYATGNNFNSNLEGNNELETIGVLDESPNVFSKMTGAVVGTLGTTGTVATGIFICGIIGAFIFIKIKKK